MTSCSRAEDGHERTRASFVLMQPLNNLLNVRLNHVGSLQTLPRDFSVEFRCTKGEGFLF